MIRLAGIEATGSGFRARAGTLTLLFISTSASREELLELLELALRGGVVGALVDFVPDEVELDDYDELEEEEEEEEDLPEPDLHRGHPVDLHTPMKASAKGVEMLFVGFTLERWLRNCPNGPLKIGPDATGAIATLVCCWSATVTHALAGGPLTLSELEREVPMLSPETLDEHLQAMVKTGMVEARPDSGGETRYAATGWLREGIAPLTAAARMERRHLEKDTAPPDILDVEAAFQLALPLVKLPPDLAGPCRLGVQIPGDKALLAGATVEVEAGRVISSSPLLDEDAETFATGSPIDWLDTLVEPSAGRIKLGGDTRLSGTLLDGLYEVLFGIPVT
jgi:DNA-binding HxlR family transcriptional regulator